MKPSKYRKDNADDNEEIRMGYKTVDSPLVPAAVSKPWVVAFALVFLAVRDQ